MKTTRTNHRCRWIALALSIALLSSQAIAQQHVHLDEVSATACVFCTHSDTPPVAQLHDVLGSWVLAVAPCDADSPGSAYTPWRRPVARAPPSA